MKQVPQFPKDNLSMLYRLKSQSIFLLTNIERKLHMQDADSKTLAGLSWSVQLSHTANRDKGYVPSHHKLLAPSPEPAGPVPRASCLHP